MDIRRLDKLIDLDYSLAKLCFGNANIKGQSKEKLLKNLTKIYEIDIENIKEIEELRKKINVIAREKGRNDGDDLAKSSKIALLKNNIQIVISKENDILEQINLDEYLENKVGTGSWFNDADRFISQFIISRQRKDMLEKKTKISLGNKLNDVSREETNVSMEYLAHTVKEKKHTEVFKEAEIIKFITPRINNCMTSVHYNLLNLNYNEKTEIIKAVGPKYQDLALNILYYAIELVQIRKIYAKYVDDMQNPYRQSYFTPSLEDLLKAATDIFVTLPEILLLRNNDTSNEARNLRRLTNLCKTKEYLKNYDIIFQAYQNFYNNLDEERKGRIQLEFSNNLMEKYSLLSLTRFEIITPQRLINKVNIKIAEIMRKDYEYYGSEMESNISVNIIRATQYMSVEDMADVYNEMKREVSTIFNLGNNRNEEKELEYMKNLQYNFARAILAKSCNNKLKIEEEKEMLINICRDYFFEEAFDELIDVSSIKKRARIIASEKRVEKRIFKVDKLNKTFDLACAVYGEFINE